MINMLGQGGIVAVLLFLLGRVFWKVGERLVTAIDALVKEIGTHTRVDLEHHAKVTEAIAELRGRIDFMAEVTPIETPIPVKKERSMRYHVRARSEPGGGDKDE